MSVSRLLRNGAVITVLGATVLMAGCNPLKFGVNQGLRFAERTIVPPMLTDDDVAMACAAGETNTPAIYSVGKAFGADVDQLSVVLYQAAAMCAEQRALDAELRYMRSARNNQIEEAQDARIVQKRFSELAARRQYKAYLHFVNYYENKFDIKVGESCPKFKKDFDEMIYMVGFISGLQSIQNDIAAQNAVGVPKDIGAKVERGMACLDNDKWWGVPQGTRAAVWNLLPGAGEGKDPYETLKQSVRIGERKGVRMAHALYVMSAYAKADKERLRDSLRTFAATEADGTVFKADPKFKNFDAMGSMIVYNVSDRYWTENTGTRTPTASIGQFWDESALNDDSGISIDDLL